MKKEYIIDEILRTTKENAGVPLGVGRFKKETGIKTSDWYGKYWSKWGDALREAGYEPNKKQEPYDIEWLIKKLIELIREKGRFPTDGELRLKAFNDSTFPAHSTFSKRMGKGKHERARMIVEYCENHPELSDVKGICLPICASKKKIENGEIESITENFWFVYLIKSGKYYKIVRSYSPGRREYEVKLAVPEKAEIVHKISTDDPVGIEAYWHKRFEDKRKSGEWFELTSPDVKAFKRRKFM